MSSNPTEFATVVEQAELALEQFRVRLRELRAMQPSGPDKGPLPMDGADIAVLREKYHVASGFAQAIEEAEDSYRRQVDVAILMQPAPDALGLLDEMNSALADLHRRRIPSFGLIGAELQSLDEALEPEVGAARQAFNRVLRVSLQRVRAPRLIGMRQEDVVELIRDTVRAPLLHMRLQADLAREVRDQLEVRLRPTRCLSARGSFEPTGPSTPSGYRIRQTNAGWRIETPDESGDLQNMKGMGDLVRLLRTPGRVVPYAELLGTALLPRDPRSQQPALDDLAVAQIGEEKTRLEGEIEEARREGDAVAEEDSRRRLEALEKEVSAAMGLAGRSRDLNDPTDKFRSRIRNRLNNLYAKMRHEGLRGLSAHLNAAISAERVGYVYSPPSPVPEWEIEIRDS